MEESTSSTLSSQGEKNDDNPTFPSPSCDTSRDSSAEDGKLLPPMNKRKRTDSEETIMKNVPKNKRKPADTRRRIRKILPPELLDSQTVSAQKEEQERLRRLELQKSLNAFGSGGVQDSQPRRTPTLPCFVLDGNITRPVASPVFVDVPNRKESAVIVLDDSDEECDIVETSPAVSDPVIEISDSESDPEQDAADVGEDGEPETSGSHTNDDVNQPNAEGRVLVNVNHPLSEPDIFLSPYLSQCLKPHQVWYTNIIVMI